MIHMELGSPTMGRRKDGKKFTVFAKEDGTVGEEDCFRPQVPQNLILLTRGRELNPTSRERKLTNFRTLADGSVSRIKQLELGTVGTTGRHLVMYEVWKSKKYDRTVLMVLDDDGETLAGPWEPPLEKNILDAQGELQFIQGKAVIYDGGAGEIRRYELTVAREGGGLPPAPSPKSKVEIMELKHEAG